MIFRLVAKNTIDESIVQRAQAKRSIEKLVVHQDKFKNFVEQKTKHHVHQERHPQLLCRCNVSPRFGLPASCEWLSLVGILICSFSHLLTLGSLTYCECLSVVEIRRSHLLIFGFDNL